MLAILFIFLIIFMIYLALKKSHEKEIAEKEKEIAEEKREQLLQEKKQEEDRKLQETITTIAAIPRYNINIKKSDIPIRNRLRDMPDMKIRNVTKSFNAGLLHTYVVLDVETTGLNASTDRIVELSAILYEDNAPSACFTTLINPLVKIPEDAAEIHGITDSMVADAPTITQIASSFSDFVGTLPIVAYNAPFDIKFLYCSGIDLIGGKRKIFDALALVRKANSDLYSYKLENVAKSLDIFYNAHSSLDDCYVTGLVFQYAVDMIVNR